MIPSSSMVASQGPCSSRPDPDDRPIAEPDIPGMAPIPPGAAPDRLDAPAPDLPMPGMAPAPAAIPGPAPGRPAAAPDIPGMPPIDPGMPPDPPPGFPPADAEVWPDPMCRFTRLTSTGMLEFAHCASNRGIFR
jgi:hypothetical protein